MTAVYQTAAASAIAWPSPIEPLYQALPASGEATSRARRTDLNLADRLFIAGLMHIPRDLRPHGSVSWAAAVFRTSRQTLYDIRDRVGGAVSRAVVVDLPSAEATDVGAPQAAIETGRHRIARLILKLMFPGGMAYRAIQACLQEALGTCRSIGFISELIGRDGDRAGQILAALQWPDNPHELTLSRDEAYFSDRPMLLTVEPHSLAIVSGHVEESADGQRWGISLALDLMGLGAVRLQVSEDGASFYPLSLSVAKALLVESGIDCPIVVQKDVWHIQDAAEDLQSALDRQAEKALKDMFAFERPGTGPGWLRLTSPGAWSTASKVATPLMTLADETRFLIGCLHDALEIVDLRSGEIRDFDTNHWLLRETIRGLAQLDHPRVAKLVTTLTDQEPYLLTHLHGLDGKMQTWRAEANAHFELPELTQFFERAAARAWRLGRAVECGHSRFRTAAARSRTHLDALVGRDPVARALADRLHDLLDAVVRTSSASENINSILKPLIWAHRYFPTRQAAQRWLNLFILWHNMRPFERGKRAGQSPFALAGVTVYSPDGRPTDDWLEALGYPAAA
jgi:hypothetical protein